MSTCTIYNNISGALDQVITNLTMNALHHGFSENNGCTISIEVSEQADDSLRHKFSDNGCGIPIENRGKIFDPFSPRAEMKAAPLTSPTNSRAKQYLRLCCQWISINLEANEDIAQ